jgi:hypothetical protein
VICETYLAKPHNGTRLRLGARARVAALALATIVVALGSHAASARAASNHFTFVIDKSWTSQERAKLEGWLNPAGPVMATVLAVAGPPSEDLTLTIVKESSGFAGEYDSLNRRVVLSALQLSVLVHELNHATRNRWILSDLVWEEGLARAGETEIMRLLAQKGIVEEGYFDYNHSYGYDEYYDQSNVASVGVPDGSIRIEPALTLVRYEQAGYGFSKVLIENPGFIAQFNASLFTRPSGALSQTQLVGIAKASQPTVEGQPFAKWRSMQHIFDINQKAGCYLFARTSQFTVDMYCTDTNGNVTPQSGATLSLKITDATNTVVFKESATTSTAGWVNFTPSLSASIGRIKLHVEAASATGTAKATFYRQSAPEEGVFGVVTNASNGTVSFSSVDGQFTAFSVPVANGAFAAPSLTSVRGQIVAKFGGEGLSAEARFDKDAAPYSVELRAK